MILMKSRSILSIPFLGILVVFLGVLIGTHSREEAAAPESFPAHQNPSGRGCRIFAPGIISTEQTEFANTFSPDGREMFFSRVRGKARLVTIMSSRKTREEWSPPIIAPFSGTFNDVDPMFSPDGKRIFFCSDRPPSGSGPAKKDFDIWETTRSGSGWSPPVRLGAPVNTTSDEFYPSLARDGTFFFVSDRPGGMGFMDFYCARPDGERNYIEVQNLGPGINSPYREGDGFISPGNEFFLFSSFRPDRPGNGDLYISFRNWNGTWSPAENLGPGINSPGNELTPFITADGNDLYFASDRTGNDEIYHMETRAVPALSRRLFLFGGFREKEYHSDVISAPLAAIRAADRIGWDLSSHLPETLQGHTATLVGDNIYIIGGLTSFSGRQPLYSDAVYAATVMDDGIEQWERIACLPLTLGYHVAVRHERSILVCGGYSSSPKAGDLAEIRILDIDARGRISRQRMAGRMPRPLRGHCAVVHRGRLFVLGGHNDAGYSADVLSVKIGPDGLSGPWSITTSLPLPLVHFAAVVASDRMYVLGGQDESGGLHAEIYSAKIDGEKIGPWKLSGSLPVPSARFTANVLNDLLIITGGGFGWEPPVSHDIYSAAFDNLGRLCPWHHSGTLPKAVAFHAAVIWPQ